jgi:DNA modification methylase
MSETTLNSVETIFTGELEFNWHNAPRECGHRIHTLSAYVGGFPPALARYFINRYTNEGNTVLDPFCGGGTTPLGAGICDRHVLANDAFSYAHILTKDKCNSPSPAEFENYLSDVLDQMNSLSNGALELENEDIEISHSEDTLNDILRMKEYLLTRNHERRTFSLV